jgi:hypothetical protein
MPATLPFAKAEKSPAKCEANILRGWAKLFSDIGDHAEAERLLKASRLRLQAEEWRTKANFEIRRGHLASAEVLLDTAERAEREADGWELESQSSGSGAK